MTVAAAGIASIWLLGRAVTDGRLGNAGLCLALALASAVLWGVEL